MKLKYYMRGLGIGIILTTLILRIGGTKEQISDQEVINRAEALGMEMKEESNSNLDKVLDHLDATGTPAPEPSVTEAAEPTVKPIVKPTAGPTAFPTYKPLAQPTKIPVKKSVSTNTETGDKKPESGISFTIKQGMSSSQVADLLVKKGLVEDGDAFNQYLVSIGKSNVIRIGKYSLPKASSYKDIIGAITKNQE